MNFKRLNNVEKGWKLIVNDDLRQKIEYKTQISLRVGRKDVRSFCDILHTIIGMQAKENAALFPMHDTRGGPRAHISSRRQISRALWLWRTRQAEQIRSPGWREPFPGPFHARFNRDSSTPLHNAEEGTGARRWVARVRDRRDEKPRRVVRPEPLDRKSRPRRTVAERRRAAPAPEHTRLHDIRYVKPPSRFRSKLRGAFAESDIGVCRGACAACLIWALNLSDSEPTRSSVIRMLSMTELSA